MSIIKKNLEVGLDLSNPLGQCNNENILYILRNKYQNRCYRHCLILSIDEIIRKGECIINPIVGVGTIAIIIQVTAIEYSLGDVITGCLIEDVNDRAGIITCTTKYASVLLKRSKNFESLQKGQLINIKVGTAKYSIGSYKIAVNGTAYLPSKQNPIYEIIGTTYDEQILTDVKARIEAEEAAANDLRGGKSWKVFKQLTAAYSTPPKIGPDGKILTLSSADIIATAPKYISRDARLDLTMPVILALDSTDIDTVKVSLGEALVAVHEDYCAQLRIIREMLEVYSTQELIQKHSNLWNIYRINMQE